MAKPSGEVIAGNTRLKAAQEMGAKEVPVVWFGGSDLDATAYQIADNRTHEFAEWDEEGLAGLLGTLRAEDALEGVGFDEAELDALLASLSDDADPDIEDPGPEVAPDEPVTRAGDLWLLGEHRLICGDSTDAGTLSLLMGDEVAHLLATDPPYLVDYTRGSDGAGGDWDAFEGAGEGVGFYDAFLQACLPHLVGDAAIYQWHATRRQALVEQAWVQNDLLVHQSLIWAKPRGLLGRSMFMWRHEPCFMGWRKGSMPPKDRRSPHNVTTVWEIDHTVEERPDHPTPKPLEIFTRPMQYHTRRGEVALEPFSGSGAQIIAAEQVGRRCFAIELSPGFVDVAVRRWEKATGRKAVLEETGKAFAEVAEERA